MMMFGTVRIAILRITLGNGWIAAAAAPRRSRRCPRIVRRRRRRWSLSRLRFPRVRHFGWRRRGRWSIAAGSGSSGPRWIVPVLVLLVVLLLM